MFSGGKMYHLFRRNDEHLYTNEFDCEESKDALLYGTFYVKINGSNNMLTKSPLNNQWYCYQRYDDKKGTLDDSDHSELEPCSGLPYTRTLQHSLNPDVYYGTKLSTDEPDEKSKKHHYYYVLRERYTDLPEGKRPRNPCKLNKSLYRLIDQLSDSLNERYDDTQEYMTVELVGKKFNRTIGIDTHVAIAIHKDQLFDIPYDSRTYESIRDMLLSEFVCEGFVVEHNGRYWKILSECFDKNCQFKQLRKSKTNDLPNQFIRPVIVS